MNDDTSKATRGARGDQDRRRYAGNMFTVPRITAGETISAVSLNGTSTLAPELVSLIQLDTQIAANNDTKLKQDLDLQRRQVLDAAFSELLGRLSRQWSSFAPSSAFGLAFAELRRCTGFDLAPFDQAAAAIEAMPAPKRNADQTALLAARRTYA